jgi:prophage regulatory protein
MATNETARLVLRPREAASFLGISKPTLYRYIRAGHIPAPRRIGPNAVGWTRADLEAWVDELPATDAEPVGAA